MEHTTTEKEKLGQMRLSFREMLFSAADEWAVINDIEQRTQRLEKLLKELKIKFEKKDFGS